MPCEEPTTKNVSVTDFPIDKLEKLRAEVRDRWDKIGVRLHLRVSDGDAVAHGARCWATREQQTVDPAGKDGGS